MKKLLLLIFLLSLPLSLLHADILGAAWTSGTDGSGAPWRESMGTLGQGTHALVIGPSSLPSRILLDGQVVLAGGEPSTGVSLGPSRYRGFLLPPAASGSHILRVTLGDRGDQVGTPDLWVVDTNGLAVRLTLLNLPLEALPISVGLLALLLAVYFCVLAGRQRSREMGFLTAALAGASASGLFPGFFSTFMTPLPG